MFNFNYCAVTGGTGHIGNVLIRKLVQSGKKVKALVLPNEKTEALDGLDVEIIKGNVNDKESLDILLKDVDVVFHLAGIISIESGKKKIMEKVNVEGTKNVIAACRKNNVKRMVYTSSVHAILSENKLEEIVEPLSFDEKKIVGNYARSKAKAASFVYSEFKKGGLDVVTVFPSGVIGPYEYKLSNLGQLIQDFTHHKLTAYVEGAYNFVDVRDVCNGIILASERGEAGEGYILSGERVTVKEMFTILTELTGVKGPRNKIAMWFVKATAFLSEIYYKLRRIPPLYTGYALYTLTSNCNISNEKAKKQLGYETRPPKDSLRDAVKWLSGERDLKLE